jgi:tetratricopeptide (TPR) repeat protein
VKFREDREAEIGVHWALASAYNGLGQLPQAVEQSRIAHELAEHALARESKAYVRVARTEIEWLLQARRYIEMEQLAVSALETSRRVYGPAHAVTRSVWRYGVVARARQSSPEVAAMLLRDLEKDAGVDGSADGRRQPLTIVTELPSSAPPDGHRAQTLTTQPKRPAVAVMPAPVAVVPAPAAVLHAPAPVAHAAAPASAPAPVPSRDGWREGLWAACRTVTTGENPDEAEDAVRAALASAAAETTRTSDAMGDAQVCERAGWHFSSERRHAAAAQVKAGGAESPALIVAQVNLAEALRAAGMMEEYKRTLTGLLAIARDHEAQGDGRAPAVTFQIALALRALDERGVELAAWRIAQEVSTSAWGPQYGIDRHVQLGNCLARKGNVAEAEQVLRHARDLHAQYSGRTSMAYAQTTRDLAEVVLESGRVEEAVKLYREVVEVAGGAGESADDLGQALLALAGALGMEHAAEAEATYSRAVQHWAAAKSAAGTGRAERALGLFYLEQERYELAEEQLLAARRNFEQLRGTGAAGRLDVTADLVELYNACGKPAEAARWEGRLPGAAAVTVVEAAGR